MFKFIKTNTFNKGRNIIFLFTEDFLKDSDQIKSEARKYIFKYKGIGVLQLIIITITLLLGLKYTYAFKNIYLILAGIFLILDFVVNNYRKKYIKSYDEDTISLIQKKYKYIKFKEYLDDLVNKNIKDIEFNITNDIFRLSYSYNNRRYNYISPYKVTHNYIEQDNDEDTVLSFVDTSKGNLDFVINISSKIDNDLLKGKYKICGII